MKTAGAVFFGILLVVSVFSASDLKNIKLKYMPTDDPGDYAPDKIGEFIGHSLTIDTIGDCRTNTESIAVNIADRSNPKHVTTKKNIPSFIKSNEGKIFSFFGLSNKKPNRYHLRGRLIAFEVVEANIYRGRVSIDFAVVGNNNDTLSTCEAVGKSNHTGPPSDYSAYMNCFSNALNDCFNDLFSKCGIAEEGSASPARRGNE